MTQIFAHRGASTQARENTAEAFRLALEMGADGIELDVRRSADGVLVVHHDAELADGRLIGTLNSGELPEWLPTLGQALLACGDVAINVEIKQGPGSGDPAAEARLVDETMEMLRTFSGGQLTRRWLISSFRMSTVERVIERFPGVRTAWLVGDINEARIERAAQTGCEGINPDDRYITKPMLDLAHRAGLQVGVWTVDDPARISDLVGWGIDTIFTNVPDVALRCRELRPQEKPDEQRRGRS